MNYTNLFLFGLGMLGVIFHVLTEIDNKIKSKEGFTFGSYFASQWASILSSICVVVFVILVKHEVAALEKAGKWLGLFVGAIGYSGRSVAVKGIRLFKKKIFSNFGDDKDADKDE